MAGNHMPELPDFIWQHIVSFLILPGEIWNLHGVNRLLSDIALNSQYRSWVVDLNYGQEVSSVLNFSRLLKHTARVRKLNFRPMMHIVPKATKKKKSPWLWTSETSFSILKKLNLRNDTKIVTHILRQLPNISTVRLNCTFDNKAHIFEAGIPLIREAFQAYTHSLRFLQVEVPLYLISNVLATAPTFSNLEGIRIRLFDFPPGAKTELLQKPFEDTSVAPFINRHRQSLQSLEINFRDITFDLTRLFDQLLFMPHLRTVVYRLTQMDDPSSTHRFFQRHAPTLRSLKIHTRMHSALTPLQFLRGLQVPFPELQHLLIGLGSRSSHSVDTEVFCGFLKHCSNSLTNLQLHGPYLPHTDLFNILDCFPSPSKLKYLRIQVRDLTPRILDRFSTQFLLLEELDITSLGTHFTEEQVTPPINELTYPQFEVEMRKRCYIHWHLQHLNLSTLSSGEWFLFCIIAVVEALPRLITINGIPKSIRLEGYREQYNTARNKC